MKNSSIPTNLKRDLRTAHDWHMYWVFNDPEFQAIVDEFNKHTYKPEIRRQKLTLIGRQFGLLSIDVFRFSKKGVSAVSRYKHSRGVWQYNEEQHSFKVVIYRNTTLKEYKNLWNEIQHFKVKELKIDATKIKSPEDTRLLYAIFKARKNKTTFTDIFNKYQSGSLPYYEDGVTNQFSSADSLARYFRRYEPIGQLKKTLNGV